MDFLRLHLPGLHQALRGALDSFSTFVSYLIGDEVPTVEREPTQAAEELGEVAAEKPGNVVGEEAQEALEGLRSEQSWGWEADSSPRSHADRQDTGARKAAGGGGGREPNALLEAGMRSEAEPGTYRDRSNRTQENWEPGEKEMNSGEPLRTWEQEEEEEEEEVRATELEMTRGVESQPTWHRELEGKIGVDEQKVTEDSKEAEWVAKEAVTETQELEGKIGVDEQKVTEDSKEAEWVAKEAVTETQEPGAKGADSEEERTVLVRDDQSAGAQETQGPRAGSKDWTVWSREELGTASGREKADILGVQETEYWPGTEENLLEATGGVQVLEEVHEGDQEEEVDKKRESEERLQNQSLELEGTKEAAEGHAAWQSVVGQETGEGFEDKGRQDSAIRANEMSLEEEMQAQEAPRDKGGCWTTEALLALDKETEGELDLTASPEAQTRQKVLRVKVTEGQEPDLMGDVQTSPKHPEDGQKGQKETERASGLSTGETPRSLEEHPSPMESSSPEVETREVDNRDTQQVREEETASGQVVDIQAAGGQESPLPEVPAWGAEEALASIAMNQELEGSQRAEIGPSQSQGGSEVRGNQVSEGEAASTSRGGGRMDKAALSLQDSEDTQTSSLAAETIPTVRSAGAGERPEWKAGVDWKKEFGMGWHSKGKEEAREVTELGEATENQSEQEVGLEGSAEEKVTGHSVQEIGKIRKEEQGEVGTSVREEGVSRVTSASQAERAERPRATVQTEGLLREQMLLEEEARGGQETEWRDHRPDGEAQKLQDVEDVLSEGQRPVVLETDPEGLEDTPSPEGEQAHQVPAVAVPGPPESAEATASVPGDASNDWSEAPLPGSRLDVSVPRSRVLLSRSASQRRSRPSFRRAPAAEQQHNDPPSHQPQEGLPDPQQPPLQPEETPEPSRPRPEGTAVPAKRKPVGRGFGLAHSGMMQELQARMNRSKPQ